MFDTATFDEELARIMETQARRGLSANGNLYFECLHAYVRVGPRYIDRTFQIYFQIAKVDAHPMGTGAFRRFLIAVRERTPLPFYVELVHNERLAATLVEKLGFHEAKRDPGGAADYVRMY